MTDFIGRRRVRVLSGLAAMGSGLVYASALAQTAPPFAQLFRDTRDAPRQIELDAEVERAQGLARQAGARPNPTISVMTENVAGRQPYTGFDRAENTLQLNQAIEIGGKRSARIAAGKAGLDAATARTRDGRITYAYQLALAYAGAEIADRRIELAEDELEEAQSDLHAAQALVDAGKEARLRSLQAESEVNAMAALLDTAKAERVGAYARLSALSGQEVSFTALAEPLLARFEARSGYGPVDPLQTAPYLAAKAEREAAERRLVAARRQATPDVTLSVGVRRLEADKANALLAGLSVPIPLFDRNRGNIDAAEAELRGAQARDSAALLDIKAEIAAAMALNEAADARAASAERTLKTAEETYRMARLAYEAGKSPLIELLAARHGLGVARGVILDAAAARLDARARLARLKGLTITGEPVQ
ncbi:TolC family protein [Novosphingobium sp. RL4]|uniref:TolC family protein n=1 Tax=Novosphingobium sp. RL4 TaxID=3109595 RepID=UPI002D76EB74|nr:TolC family protein [Novosphingobium sp. RL4]WRT96052.1 TolC family protein [Novosphingobium sp. RL4]